MLKALLHGGVQAMPGLYSAAFAGWHGQRVSSAPCPWGHALFPWLQALFLTAVCTCFHRLPWPARITSPSYCTCTT